MMLSNEKAVSERYQEAISRGMLTAGDVAKLMRNTIADCDVKARELNDHADEWHHSGFFDGGAGKVMGKTYFFSPCVDIEALWNKVQEDRIAHARPRFAFGVKFHAEGAGRQKHYIPTADFIEVAAGKKIPKKYEQITVDAYDALAQFNGEALKPYESLAEFRKRMGPGL